MQYKYLFLFSFIALSCTNGKNKFSSNLEKDSTTDSDTIFLKKESHQYGSQIIFIDENKNSEHLKRLKNFSFSKFDQRSFDQNIKYIHEKCGDKYQQFNVEDLPKEWIPLYQYKNEFYTYGPVDWGRTGRKLLNDSLYISWMMDGPFPYKIEEFKKIKDNHFRFKYEICYGESNRVVNLHILDTATQMTIWEYDLRDRKIKELYIPKEKASHFDMIVNYCIDEKFDEFTFDNIDFDELRKK